MEKSTPLIKLEPTILIIILALITLIFIPTLNASPELEISVKTDREIYWLGSWIEIYGNLTLSGSAFPYGLVAVEIDDPRGNPIAIRVTDTGSPILEPQLEIIAVAPCDSTGNPQYSFARNQFAYFNVTIINHVIDPKNVTVTITIYDSLGYSIGINYGYRATLPGSSRTCFIIPVLIPIHSSLGTATAYATALSDLPQKNGTAYCLEKSATFEISGSKSGSTTGASITNLAQIWGRYEVDVRPSISCKPGIYTVHATSILYYEIAHNQTSFEIDVPDLNNDGAINVLDLLIISAHYGLTSEDPGWDPTVDLNDDEIINVLDLLVIAACYGWQDQ